MNLMTSSASRQQLTMPRIPLPLRGLSIAPLVLGLFTLTGNAAGQTPAPTAAAAAPKTASAPAATPSAKPVPAPKSEPASPTPAESAATATAAADAPATTATPAPAAATTSAPEPTAAPAAAAPVQAPTANATAAAVSAPLKPVAPPEPEQPLYAFLDVGVVVHTLWNTAPAYDFFDDDDHLVQGGISLGADVLDLTPQTVLNVDVSAITGETESTGPLPVFVSHAKLERTDVGAGVSVRHHIWSWLAPYGRVSGAAAFEKARVDVQDAGVIERKNTKLVGAVAGGLSLFSPAKRLSATQRSFNSIALRVNVEGGYQFTGAIPFELAEEPAAEDSRNIRQAATPFGDLKQSGAYLRVTVGAHF